MPKIWPVSVIRVVAALATVIALGACAPKRFEIPASAGVPVPDVSAAWGEAARACAGVRTLTAELSLSGRAAGARLRGRVQAGFESPARIRLEGVAPFGQPVFILAGDASSATLLLPRDARVVRAAATSELLDALAGVRLDADALRAVLAGCVTTGTPTSATDHGTLRRFAFADDTVYARRASTGWRIIAGQSQSFLIEYLDFSASGWPARVRITRRGAGGQQVDMTIAISQLRTNLTLPSGAFVIVEPADVLPMTLEELRRAGPLGAGD